MATLEKERLEERVEVPEEQKAPSRRRYVWFGLLAVAVALIAAAGIVALFMGGGGGEETTEAVVAPPAAAATEPATMPEVRSEQQILADLARRGYIPMAAVDWELLKTEELVNQGLIPAQVLRPYVPPVEPLFTAEEMASIELAQAGGIPMGSVDWDRVELKRLVNRGFIPRQTLEPQD
jgi:hypothetical protein